MIDAARPAIKGIVWSWLWVLGLVVCRLPTLLLLYHCTCLSLPLLSLWLLLSGGACEAANRGSIRRVQSPDGSMHRRLCSTFDTLPTRVHLRDIVHLRISCHGPIGGRSISPSSGPVPTVNTWPDTSQALTILGSVVFVGRWLSWIKPRNWLARRVCSRPNRHLITNDSVGVGNLGGCSRPSHLRDRHTRLILVDQHRFIDFLFHCGCLARTGRVQFAARVEIPREPRTRAKHDIHWLGVRVLQLGRW